MTKKLILLIVLTIAFSAFCRVGNSATRNLSNNPPDELKIAPDFALKSIDGKTVRLSDFRGKIVIVDFWATWCPPCRRGIPDLIAIQNEYAKDVVVIGISVDAESKPDVPGFAKKMGINYPILYFTPEVVKAYGGIEGIPTAFLINGSGVIVDSHVGLVPKSVYTDAIQKLIAAKPVPAKDNQPTKTKLSESARKKKK